VRLRLGVTAKLDGMDEGLPIAYLLLEREVPVYASGGEQVGTVDHVVAAPDQDIFHGIVLALGHDRRFVAADQIASLHEHGVDLNIDAAQAATLPSPHGGAPVFRDVEPGAKPSAWGHFLNRMGGQAGRDGWKRE
jgi:hypothetical protein